MTVPVTQWIKWITHDNSWTTYYGIYFDQFLLTYTFEIVWPMVVASVWLSENAHSSWTAWNLYILIKFCILIYILTLVLVCNTVRTLRLCYAGRQLKQFKSLVCGMQKHRGERTMHLRNLIIACVIIFLYIKLAKSITCTISISKIVQ